jgi:hypothetical protein
MSDSQARFEQICEHFLQDYEHIAVGKMMSSNGISYKGKFIAFYMSDDSLCFKLGREFNLEEHGISEYRVLSPFKNKAPMLDWIIVSDADKWDELARIALKRMQATLD